VRTGDRNCGAAYSNEVNQVTPPQWYDRLQSPLSAIQGRVYRYWKKSFVFFFSTHYRSNPSIRCSALPEPPFALKSTYRRLIAFLNPKHRNRLSGYCIRHHHLHHHHHISFMELSHLLTRSGLGYKGQRC